MLYDESGLKGLTCALEEREARKFKEGRERAGEGVAPKIRIEKFSKPQRPGFPGWIFKMLGTDIRMIGGISAQSYGKHGGL